MRIAKGIIAIIQENASFSVTNLLRRCARIAELLDIDDILWINNELKGYPDDYVPAYRLIEAECHYSWIGALPSYISVTREKKETFYKRWKEKVVIRDSSIMLESLTRTGHDVELRKGILYGTNVKEIAYVKPEQYWEMLHQIVDKIREFASRIDMKLTKQGVILERTEQKIIAFLSASFSKNADSIISWFIKTIKSLDIEVIWLKEKYQARPTEEKIKENIRRSNCLIQIITKNVYNEGKEAGWLGNEIAWARDSTPNGNMAIFVEKGIEASGLARTVADNLSFDFENIVDCVPKIVQYLNDLKKRVNKTNI